MPHGKCAAALLLLATFGLIAGCRRSAPPERPATPAPSSYISYLRPEPIGAPVSQPPWIAHVNAVDLDRDGLLDILAAEAQENKIVWVRQTERGRYAEQLVAADLKAPVRVEPADMDGDGDLDLLVASMGYVFPNNDKIGSVIILENDGRQHFAPRYVLEHTTRVTDVRAGDFDGDGRLDLAVAQFGYDQGEVRWMRRTGAWEFESHVLLELSGAVNVSVADFNGDARPDIVTLISQQWEEIYLFENRGNGAFERRRIWGSTNEDYGSSGISVCDLNRDGRPDILYSNGDGFGPATLPGPRPWHGVQWLENAGNGFFHYHRLGNLPGAYSPVGVDLDQDGATDVVAVAAYVQWDKQTLATSLMWFRNKGRMDFEPRVLAHAPQNQVTVTAGDFAGNGQPALVTGGFYVFAPYENMERITLWQR